MRRNTRKVSATMVIGSSKTRKRQVQIDSLSATCGVYRVTFFGSPKDINEVVGSLVDKDVKFTGINKFHEETFNGSNYFQFAQSFETCAFHDDAIGGLESSVIETFNNRFEESSIIIKALEQGALIFHFVHNHNSVEIYTAQKHLDQIGSQINNLVFR